jgi:hypothetical protein
LTVAVRGAEWRRPAQRIAAAATLSLLAACADMPPPFSQLLPPAPPDPPAQASEPPPAPDPSPAPAPAQAVAPDYDDSPAARAARAAGRQPMEASREPLPRDLPRLTGLSRETVLDLLGPAGFVRRDGPVQIWRYTGDDCFLDLFLFREGDAFRVNHVEARAKTAGAVAVYPCYQRLVATRRAARSG